MHDKAFMDSLALMNAHAENYCVTMRQAIAEAKKQHGDFIQQGQGTNVLSNTQIILFLQLYFYGNINSFTLPETITQLLKSEQSLLAEAQHLQQGTLLPSPLVLCSLFSPSSTPLTRTQ